jgi:neutral ceramidase
LEFSDSFVADMGPESRVILALLAAMIFTFLMADGLSIGRGIADITGLASEGALYGYASPNQDARGIHLRQYSRAFVFSDGIKTVAFVVAEVTMISQAVHLAVMEQLSGLYNGLLSEDNVLLTATHTHAGPGGYHTFWMYQTACGGFVNQTYDVTVNGIVQSIVRAYEDVQPATILLNSGLLFNASANRSPYAYWNNPQSELDEWGNQDTDKTMVLLKAQDESGENLGLISFFGVHETSMKNFNHLVSSDNKGVAAQYMERYLNPGQLPGQVSVITAFSQTSEGDSSPNTLDARCELTFDFCSYNTSTCPEEPNNPRLCTGRGPANEQFDDTRIIGERQYLKARELFDTASIILDGPVDYRFQWVNMSNVEVVQDGVVTTTCRPAMGYSFAAGATDGPGVPPFTQAMLDPLETVDNVIERLYNMSDELRECHAPKPILFPTGELERPWQWQPEILPVQLLRIGDLVLIGLPTETTTMSGRRLQKAVKEVLLANGYPPTTQTLVISLSNAFVSYLTTFEEYQMQRYEGASTTFGPNQLQAYTKLVESLALAMATGEPVDKGPEPVDFLDYPEDALGFFKVDITPEGTTFGDVLEDVLPTYGQGERASVSFVAGNPRNDLKTDGTFLEVQQWDSVNSEWVVKFIDADVETQFHWTTACLTVPDEDADNCTRFNQESTTTINWDIPTGQEAGRYRIVHYGNARTPEGFSEEYIGVSSEFEVVVQKRRRWENIYSNKIQDK